MTDMIGYIIVVLTGIVLLLELIKIICYPNRPVEQGFDTGSCMTIGSREVQEDQTAVLTTEAGTMAVLADGAGKTYGGRIAARTAVNVCVEFFQDYNAFNNPQYYFRRAFQCANREILKAVGEENRGTASVGCAMIRDGYLYYALAGNIKIAVFRDGTLVPVSAGHTIAVLAEKKFKEGRISRQDALTLLENHRIYNYLGKDEFKDIEFFDAPIRLKTGDTVVLMSDGIYDFLGFREVEAVLRTTESCQKKALQIIEKVNQSTAEDKDNASIILIAAGNGAIV